MNKKIRFWDSCIRQVKMRKVRPFYVSINANITYSPVKS